MKLLWKEILSLLFHEATQRRCGVEKKKFSVGNMKRFERAKKQQKDKHCDCGAR
jgi:hypothetical protein